MATDHAERTTAPPPAPLPNGDPATWVYAEALPLPEEDRRRIEDEYRPWWFNRWFLRESRALTEFVARLAHSFPGKTVVYRVTEKGRLILFVGEPLSGPFEAFYASVPREQRLGWLTFEVRDPHDNTSRIG